MMQWQEIKTNADVIEQLMHICKAVLKGGYKDTMSEMHFKHGEEYRLEINFTVNDDHVLVGDNDIKRLKEIPNE